MDRLDINERKVALITGITGQDGSYLAELLLEKGYDVSCIFTVYFGLTKNIFVFMKR